MARHSFAFALCAYGAFGFVGMRGADPGCGGSESPSSGANAPCTRSKDCTEPLTCSQGVCTEPDSGISGMPPSDGGRDAASDRDDGG